MKASPPTLTMRMDAVAAMFQRDLRLYFSYRSRVLSQILQTVFSLTLFYYVSRLVRVPEFGTSDRYFAFVVIGLVILELLTSTLVIMPSAVRQELVAGTFERLVVSPFGPVSALVSMAAFPIVFSLALGGVTIGLAAVIFGIPVAWSTIGFAIPVAMLAALALAPLALVITSAVLVVKQAGTSAGFAVTLLSLVGGFFFPVDLLPAWIRWTSDVQPVTPALDLLRHLIVGTPLTSSVALTVLKLAAFVIVLVPLSAYALRAALAVSRKRGTIIEY